MFNTISIVSTLLINIVPKLCICETPTNTSINIINVTIVSIIFLLFTFDDTNAIIYPTIDDSTVGIKGRNITDITAPSIYAIVICDTIPYINSDGAYINIVKT